MATGGVVNSTIIEPIQVLYRGHNKALYALAAASQTLAVVPNGTLDGTNANIPTNRPLGVLSGMAAIAATISGEDFGCGVGNITTQNIGLFVTNYEGNGFENSPGVASGKVSVISAPAVCKVYIFETINSDGSTAITYTIGGILYVSNNGLITSQDEGGGIQLGRCVHVPTTAEDWVGIELV